MEKQEILEKSRRENQKGDERERTIRMEGESFSLLFVFLMGLILLTWKRDHVLDGLRGQPGLPAGPAAEYLRHRDAADLSCVFDLESGKILSNGLRGGSAWTGMRF